MGTDRTICTITVIENKFCRCKCLEDYFNESGVYFYAKINKKIEKDNVCTGSDIAMFS